MLKCWSEQQEKRPSFADLVPTLTGLLEEVAEYLDFSIVSGCELKTGYDHLEKVAGYDHLEDKTLTPGTSASTKGYDHLQEKNHDTVDT